MIQFHDKIVNNLRFHKSFSRSVEFWQEWRTNFRHVIMRVQTGLIMKFHNVLFNLIYVILCIRQKPVITRLEIPWAVSCPRYFKNQAIQYLKIHFPKICGVQSCPNIFYSTYLVSFFQGLFLPLREYCIQCMLLLIGINDAL